MKKILSLWATPFAVALLAGCQTAPGVGRSMDDTDRMKTALALEGGRSGVASSWRAAN